MSLNDFNLRIPYPDVFPPVWGSKLPGRDTMLFRNLDHFIYEVSHLTQKEDQKCGMSYAAALDLLKRRQSDFPETRQAEIRNLVRSNLHKRGLISEETYEAYRYSVDGTQVGVDVGKYANGEADCVITPARHYVDFFHELYVSISYPWNVENKEVRENTAKLLATVEELERQHIFIKITLVLPISGAKNNGSHFFSSIPLFSHKDFKSVEIMSAVINDRLLRKFYFAILENLYQDEIAYGYGHPVDLDTAMCIGNTFDEIAFFQEVVLSVGA